MIFFEGTYAARICFYDNPIYGSDGDAVIQTFFTMKPYITNDPNFSEIDFEYLPNSWKAYGNSQMDFTGWETAPDDRENCPDYKSYDQWHVLLMHVNSGNKKISFYIEGENKYTTKDTKYFPEPKMGIFVTIQIRLEGKTISGKTIHPVR